MIHSQHSTFWLGLAFAAVLSMMAGLGLFGMSRLSFINKNLDEIAGELQSKISLTTTMRYAARERTVNLLHIIILDDPFDKDDAWMQFNQHASEFIIARRSLADKTHSPLEQIILDKQAVSSRVNAVLQMEIAQLALAGKNTQATALLINKAIPLQKDMLQFLDDLYLHYTTLLAEKKQSAELAYTNTYQIGWIVGSITFLLGTFIATISVRRTYEIKNQLIKHQTQLKSSQEQLQMALDASNSGIWDWDIKNNSMYYSPRWLEMFGYGPDDGTANLFFWLSSMYKEDRPQANKKLQDHLDGVTDTCLAEYRLCSKNGSWLWVMGTAKVTEYDDRGKPARAVGTHTVITDRKNMELELIQRQYFFKGVLDDLQTAVIVLDPQGTVMFVNDSPLKNIGFNAEMLGQKFWQCPLWAFSNELCKQIEDHIKFVEKDQYDIDDIEIKTAEESIWLALSIHPVFDEHGKVEYVVPECRDVSDRVYMENALRRSQKMDSIGQLSGGIAHDFNNQLGVVSGYMDLLESRISASDVKSKRWISTTRKATQRCIDLTRQLLTLSRHQVTEIRNVNVSEVIHSMKEVFDHSVTPEIQIRLVLTEDLWICSLDEAELQDALLNIVINARDAMPEGGEILLETTNTTLTVEKLPLVHGIEAGEYIKLMISDTGCGMSCELIDQVFEPFFTTKARGEGTGLGLSMVYAFVKRYKSFIHLYSEENKGSTVALYFPRASTEKTLITPSVDTVYSLPMGQESILIVDDEKDLLDVACLFLQDLGYNTYSADTPLKAIDILEQHSDIDMLFSDILMPGGINGYELADRADKLRPGIKILLTSGFSSIDSRRYDSTLKVLNKPYGKATLADTVRHILDKGKS